MNRRKIMIASLGTLATAGVIGAAAAVGGTADLADSVVATSVGSDKATQVHMRVTNNTGEALTLSDPQSKGSGNHWQDRPTDLAVGAATEASNYAAGDAEIDLTYTGVDSGAVFQLHAETTLDSDNYATATTTNPSYTVSTTQQTGFSPLYTFTMEPGHTFNFTGKTDTYTVPPGITKLTAVAMGGMGGNWAVDGGNNHAPSGARVAGILDVTPGEVLTVGVGGVGGNPKQYTVWQGGWGMQNGSSDYSGGNGVDADPTNATGGGGGASVVLDGAGEAVVVAGGGGGEGSYPNDEAEEGAGGRGGYNGSLTGENGGPDLGGGKAGANSVSHGQDSPTGGSAGGGGVNGGLAGAIQQQGGGAGSSSDSGLDAPNVSTAPADSSYTGGQITIAASPQ